MDKGKRKKKRQITILTILIRHDLYERLRRVRDEFYRETFEEATSVLLNQHDRKRSAPVGLVHSKGGSYPCIGAERFP